MWPYLVQKVARGSFRSARVTSARVDDGAGPRGVPTRQPRGAATAAPLHPTGARDPGTRPGCDLSVNTPRTARTRLPRHALLHADTRPRRRDRHDGTSPTPLTHGTNPHDRRPTSA